MGILEINKKEMVKQNEEYRARTIHLNAYYSTTKLSGFSSQLVQTFLITLYFRTSRDVTFIFMNFYLLHHL